MSDDKSQLTISIDIKAEDRKYQIVENSVTSILFKVSDTTTRYVYNIRMGEMRNESETTPEGLKNLNLKKECDLSVKIRTEADQAFVLSEKHCGNIMLVEFFKYEGIPVLCASCVLIVKPSDLKITQVIFKDSTGKEVGCGSVLNPGTVIGRNSNIYPLSPVRGCIPADSIYKNAAEIVKKN